MTVETTQTKHIYNGNGVAREWPVSFPYTQIADIRLAVVDVGGKLTEVASGFDVQVGAGGTTVTYPVQGAPLASGTRLVIYRKTPTTQLVDLQNGGAFQPDVLEHDALDRTVMMVQEQQEQLDRAVKVPIGSESTAEQLLESIYTAQEDAKAAATIAIDSQGAAENSANRARVSEVLAARAKADACACADIAEAAKDTAIAQAEATNVLMAAEMGKINVIIGDNKLRQTAAVDAARAWAETPHGVPVTVDGAGNPQYSAKHFAAEAQAISIQTATEITAGVVRLGTKKEHEDGVDGVAAQCSEVKEMLALKNPTQELLTVSGAWVAPSTGIYQVELQGGGGGGGGLKGTVHFGAAAPGQAGEYRTAMLYYTKSQEIPYTIGAGGSATVNNGGTGGGTVFDFITARGGAGGIGGVISASAGYILTGLTDTSVRGAIGRPAHPFFFPSAGYGCEGIMASYGADTVFGIGGRNSDYIQKGIAKFIYGTSGSGYGASGSGALACLSGDVAGGAGKQGCVRITLLVAFGE